MHKNTSEHDPRAALKPTGASNDFAPIPQLEPHFPASKGSMTWRPIVALLCILVLFAGVFAGGAFWAMYMHRHHRPPNHTDTATTEEGGYLAGGDKYVCGVAALSAVVCENVGTHAVTKYEVPHSLGAPYTLSESPDGGKILVSSLANNVQNPNIAQYFYVVDKNFTVIKQLPSALVTQSGYNYAWLPDSKSLVYDLRAGGSAGQGSISQLYIYDLSTGKTRQLTNAKSGNGLNYPTVTRSGLIIAYGREPIDTTPEELAVISSTDGSIHDIDTSEVYKDLDPQTRIFYNKSSDEFYATGSEVNNESKDITVVSRLDVRGDTLKLVPLATYQQDFDSPPTVTTKGILLNTSSTESDGKLTFYDGDDRVTKLSVNPSTFNNGMHSFMDLPFAKPAATNQLASSDYVYEYGTPPSRLDQFVRQLATQGCSPGQYKTVSLMAFDGDQQAAVALGTCGNTGPGEVHYYVYKDGAYKDVIAAEEGVSCQDAANLGLSKVVLPDCTPLGQNP